uniref:Uncharacterized protein n=1 Tax=Meloidogyne enterolobii TaxID=390850 RepID=A0A6V7W2P0_MELEN|nr:unnamed protein product [Meloidogyne enterolobii]
MSRFTKSQQGARKLVYECCCNIIEEPLKSIIRCSITSPINFV